MNKKLLLYGPLFGVLGLVISLGFTTQTTHAQCTADIGTTPIDPGPDNITCTGGVGVVGNALAGDDTISASGAFSALGGITGDAGNDSITNSGAFSGNVVIAGNDGNDSITNSGAFTGGSFILGDIDNDSITNSGAFSGNSAITGGAGNDSITNSGAFSGNSAIIGGAGNDSITNSGAFSGISGIIGDNGNDSISLLPGASFDASSWVDGDLLSSITGNNDVLILYSSSSISIPSLTNCHGLATVGAMQTNGCFVPWEGGTLYFVNFEQLQFILLAILEEQGITFSGPALPPAPSVICDDGRVKVFRLPNGDVEYYSGFDILPPNGFLVGKVSLSALADGVRTFSDPNGKGWKVVINQSGEALSGQVYDQEGNPVGNACRH